MINQSHPEIEEREAAPEKQRINFPADESLRERVREYRDHSGRAWTNSSIAGAIGYSPRVISDYLSTGGNKYDGDTKQVEARLTQFLRDQQLRLDSAVETIRSEVAQQIEDAVEEIRTAKRIGVIIGEPGIGKSRGIEWYQGRHDLAISFTTRSWHRNTNSAVNCLLEAADVTQEKRGLKSFELLVAKTRGLARPVLVDDAHKLTRGALQLFYDYRDETGCPIALFGDDRLLLKCRDDAQRLRRTGIVTRLRVKDPSPLIEHHIRSLIGEWVDPGELGELRKLARKIVDHSGKFGSLQMELSLAARLRKGCPDKSWGEVIKLAHAKLIRDFEFN